MTRRRLLTLACFLALAAVTALVVSRVSHPPTTGLLVPAALLAVVAGGIGIARPRLWPLALVLLPLGAYLVARLQIALPPDTSGVHLQLAFYAGRIADGAAVYARQHFPLDPSGADLRLLLSLFVYGVTGAAAFFALSLRRPLPGVIILLCLAGFGFTIDEAARDPWSALAFVLLAGGLLALAHPEPHVGVRLADALAGGATAIVAAVLALSVLGATTVEAGRPLQDWRTWDIAGPGNALMRFDWMQNYPRLLAEDNDAVVMEVRSPVASYWRANVLSDFTGTVWRGGLDADPLPRDRADGSWRYAVPRTADRGVQGRTVTQRFAVRSTFTDHLFVGGWAREIRTPLPLDLSVNAANAVSVDPARGPRTSYEVEAFVPDLRATNLIGLGRAYPADIADSSLGLPFPALDDVEGPAAEDRWRAAVATPEGREWAGLYRLNQSVVGDEAEPYRVALAIQGYLTGQGFEYSLRPPESDYASPYAAFLFDTHIGYCQHFAGAMALLRLAFACWREPRENPFFMAPLQAAYKHVPKLPQQGPEDPGPFAFASEARVRRILDAAGFAGVEMEACPLLLDSAIGRGLDGAVQGALEIGPVSRALEGQPEELRKAAAVSIREGTDAVRQGRCGVAAGVGLDRHGKGA